MPRGAANLGGSRPFEPALCRLKETPQTVTLGFPKLHNGGSGETLKPRYESTLLTKVRAFYRLGGQGRL